MKNNQFGRSMIEMLGVLAIIGVLSVGGLDMITKARKSNQQASFLGGISNLAGNIIQQRKYSSEVSSKYSNNYVLFLNQIGKIPNVFTYSSGTLSSELGANVSAIASTNGVFIISASGIDRETCIRTASNNWGDRTSNRFIGVIVGDSANFSCVASNSCNTGDTSAFSGQSGYPMPISKATSACSSATSNTVNLGYKL